MKHLLLSLGLCFAIVGGAVAQSSPQKAAEKSDMTLRRVREVDVLVQVLPLTLKKAQYGPILTGIEKARAKWKQITALEAKDLETIDAKLAAAVTAGVEKGEYPPRELQSDAVKLLRAMGIRRQVATFEMIEDFYNATKTTFDAGQLKVMANSLDAPANDPAGKKDAKEEDKIKFFIRTIFLDDVAYDLLLKLQKTATD